MTLIEIFKAGKRPDANGVEVEIRPMICNKPSMPTT